MKNEAHSEKVCSGFSFECAMKKESHSEKWEPVFGQNALLISSLEQIPDSQIPDSQIPDSMRSEFALKYRADYSAWARRARWRKARYGFDSDIRPRI